MFLSLHWFFKFSANLKISFISLQFLLKDYQKLSQNAFQATVILEFCPTLISCLPNLFLGGVANY